MRSRHGLIPGIPGQRHTGITPVTLTVRAVNDALIEGPHACAIPHAIGGTLVDADYQLAPAKPAPVTNYFKNPANGIIKASSNG